MQVVFVDNMQDIDGTAIIYNCYTTGEILGKTAGGICGKYAG